MNARWQGFTFFSNPHSAFLHRPRASWAWTDFPSSSRASSNSTSASCGALKRSYYRGGRNTFTIPTHPRLGGVPSYSGRFVSWLLPACDCRLFTDVRNACSISAPDCNAIRLVSRRAALSLHWSTGPFATLPDLRLVRPSSSSRSEGHRASPRVATSSSAASHSGSSCGPLSASSSPSNGHRRQAIPTDPFGGSASSLGSDGADSDQGLAALGGRHVGRLAQPRPQRR